MWMEEESRAVIEAILFAAGSGVDKHKLAALLQVDAAGLEQILQEMQRRYRASEKGIQLVMEGETLRLGTKPELSEVLEQWFQVPGKRLSPAAMETLAVIAYQQPVSRAEIEHIRGVRADRVVQTLLERELIVESGVRENVPGRPVLYATTDLFLQSFGLNSLGDLPEPEETTSVSELEN
jgi:segregation and condensation protein B